MPTSEEYRALAIRDRRLARQEALPNVKAVLAASADKWEFLARVTAGERHVGDVAALAEP